MADIQTEYHKRWLGMVEPIEGLVVSVPVLCDAQCMNRLSPEVQRRLIQGLHDGQIRDLAAFFTEILGLTPDLFDSGAALPDDLSLYVPEGQEVIRPTQALRALHPDSGPYVMLVLDLPGVPLDTPDRREGVWAYPPKAKFDRLLRACQVPIGLLTNRKELRLFYAPHGESSGVVTFRLADMASPGGGDILDAFVMLLSAQRFFGVAREKQLPQILRDSRLRQANVTNQLAEQVLDALQILLRGFQLAAERDGDDLLRDALRREPDGQHLYGGLLTVLLRLVFVLYAEDRDLLPTGSLLYAQHLSALTLFDQLQTDHGAFPDTMGRRFGAWPRLLALFRAIYGGAHYNDSELRLPARHGDLFSPSRYPFLEGWGPAGGYPHAQQDRAQMRVPTVDDETIFRVLHKLLLLDGQRLSYRALDVEQIGSVYEALMGFQVREVEARAVCLRPRRIWVTTTEIRDQGPRLAAWLSEEIGLQKAAAQKAAAAVQAAQSEDEVLAALSAQAVRGVELAQARAGQYVLQPGPERRRTSSHYTPRSLSAPIVRRTLEPLLLAMGERPSSEQLLSLKVCDPAMGSGAFLVEACRFLADQVVAAWTWEGRHDKVAAATEDVVNEARRLVAQRCLYGVDKNPFAVSLAKLSLWLVTLAQDEPFTFVDHALRHGDSLVGLSLDQLRGFHWRPEKQRELFTEEIDAALEESLGFRQRILALAGEHGDGASWEKERLLRDAEFSLDRARAIGDLVVGAFFGHEKDKEREKERNRRLDLVAEWLRADTEMPDELLAMRDEIRQQVPMFHWMLEFPEVFYAGRPDPLDAGKVNEAAFFDAFVGNPPFAGKNGISESSGSTYLAWLQALHDGAHGNADLSAHFFRRTDTLLGQHGTFGLIATNTIAQGDTRATSLQVLIRRGLIIYEAVSSMFWPGDAAVAVSVVHLAKGRLTKLSLNQALDGNHVEVINSRLRGKPERPDPVPLAANVGKAFMGSTVLGPGFMLTSEEREILIQQSQKNACRIVPYIGGENVNTSPTQGFDRYVINFGAMALDETSAWPDLIEIIREKVKPERDKNNRDAYRMYWWQYAEKRPALYEAIAPLNRCLVTAQTSKYLCYSFQPVDRVFTAKLFVFSIQSYAQFAALQSGIHEPWVRLLSSTLEDRLSYTSDCFETFPFPSAEHLTADSPLESIGERLYTARADFMVKEQKGLTQTYNLLKDPRCDDPRIVELRRLHEEMDRAVLSAYGWSDIPVPPYGTPTTPAEEKALEAFQDEVIDRLFALNAARAEDERLRGAAKKPAKAPKKTQPPQPSPDPTSFALTPDPPPSRKPSSS